MKIKTPFIIIAISLLLQPQSLPAETSHLIPVGGNILGVKGRSFQAAEVLAIYRDHFETRLACIFFSARPQGPVTAVRIFKSNEGYYATGVIVMPSMVEQTQKIDADLMELINQLWTNELLQTRVTANDNIGLDSAPVVFLGYLEGQGLIAGEMPNKPYDDCGPLTMAKVADLLIQYVNNPTKKNLLDEIRTIIINQKSNHGPGKSNQKKGDGGN